MTAPAHRTMAAPPAAPTAYEARRLHALRELDLLDTPAAEAFDRITRMAARLFNLPVAAVSLTDSDRQWFKSRVGVARASIPRLNSPCEVVTDTEAVLVVEDLLLDAHLRDSLLAREGIRFYAGAPLTTRDGYCLGAMCVLGPAPRQVSDDEVSALRDMAAMVMAQIELQHALGRLDSLSGLPNRTQFIEDFTDFCRDRGAGARHVALMLNLASPEQLDQATRVMGVSYLDEMLAEAAQWLRLHLGPGRKIYHVGATQFAWIVHADGDDATLVAQLRQMLADHARSGSARFVTTATFGLAPFLVGQSDCVDVLRWCHSAARDALDTPGRVGLYDSGQDVAYQRRFALLSAFGAALETGDQLHLVFQPRINLASGACSGAEALLRWTHPTLGVVSPGEFIPVVEQTSVVRATTAWVLEAALAQLARWQADGLALTLSVNVSSANLVEPEFAERVIDAVRRHGVLPGRLELELTESAIMENQKQATLALTAIAAAGIGLAIDDFGTGYSSLAYLQNLPADVVKIDQSFILAMAGDERTRALVATMISLSHDLGYRVVAEGVETTAALALLRTMRCDEVQGYLIARPMRPDQLVAWCAAHTASAFFAQHAG